MKSINSILRELSFDNLHEWAGAKIFNRGKGYVNQVDELSCTQGDTLVAWVTGSERYATSVRVDRESGFEHFCTCPYDWGPCKHAVAVILASAEHVKGNRTIPVLEEDSALSQALFDHSDEEIDEWEDDESGHATTPQRAKAHGKVGEFLGDKNRDELLDLLTALSKRFPDVERHIIESEQIASGQVGKLVSALRSEIRQLTAEPAWYNSWSGEGNLPDYSPLEGQLRALANQGHADAVLQLGEELWKQGNAQVEQSDDEGKTAMAISSCLKTVIAALPQSSLLPPDQLLWVIDRMLEDEFSLMDSADKLLKRRVYTRNHWQAVAKALEARLQAMPKPRAAGFSASYRRERLLNALLDSYVRAGWKERTIPLLEAEAEACCCYDKLVDELLAVGEGDRARHWCIQGHKRTIVDAPGIASALQERLRTMAQKQRRYDLVAAYRAQDFFAHPLSTNYRELNKAAEKAECWPDVRLAALHYLETGQSPASSRSKGKGKLWPLPAPEVELPSNKFVHSRFPDIDTLINIAILEQRLDDVVDLYQRLRKTKRWGWETDKKVAQAVAPSHPAVALGIWLHLVDGLIGQVKPSAYEEAAVYLRLMEKAYAQLRRQDDWHTLLEQLRREHKAKRRLMSVLDILSKKKLVE